MTAALLVTQNETLGARIQRELGECSIFTVHGTDEALRMLRITETDLVIVDGAPATRDLAHFVSRARTLYPSAVVVCLYPAKELAPADSEVPDSVDFLLLKPFTSRSLACVLRQANAKRGLLLELSALRTRQSSMNGHGPGRVATALDLGARPSPRW
jgi:DNA-binding NtrC family response regulator